MYFLCIVALCLGNSNYIDFFNLASTRRLRERFTGVVSFRYERSTAIDLIEGQCENINYENKIYAGIEANDAGFQMSLFQTWKHRFHWYLIMPFLKETKN